jgi:hypothetical protein
MLGCWLLISPFIFAHDKGQTALWANDLIAGGTLLVCSLACYWRPLGWLHWLFLPLGAWLVGIGRFTQSPPLPAAFQNEIVVGLLLMMFAIVPNEASHPPRSWRQHSRLDAGNWKQPLAR